jgi:hypothetical protein
MDHFEMVEKLREKANVSYEEAKAALEAADWNLLDALVLLENQGKVTGSDPYSTRTEPRDHDRDHRRHAEAAGRVGRQIASGINRLSGYFGCSPGGAKRFLSCRCWWSSCCWSSASGSRCRF